MTETFKKVILLFTCKQQCLNVFLYGVIALTEVASEQRCGTIGGWNYQRAHQEGTSPSKVVEERCNGSGCSPLIGCKPGC